MKMDLRGLLVLSILVFDFSWLAYGNLVFPVQHKFKGRERSLSAMKAHDTRRHGRFLSAVDFSLGGIGTPTDAGLYYTKLGLGSPPKDYYVLVDTGSDLLWVNGVECTQCPQESDLAGVELKLYDPKGSHTSKTVTCDGEFCSSTYNGPIDNCKAGMSCNYSLTYGDGSKTSGYFVSDYLTFEQVNGNLQNGPANSSVVFGCGSQQYEGSGASTDKALDGIMGFGQDNSSVLSQLAASGKVKKIFSHCLDGVHGGGIFAIGEVVEPKVNTTPLVSGQVHYNAVLKDIEVDKEFLELPISIFNLGNERGTVIDSGSTLAYFPRKIYDQLMSKIFARQPGLKLHTVQDEFTCFDYSGKVDDGFPVVKFHFQKSLSLTAYPHDYLFNRNDDEWCVGFHKSKSQDKKGKEMTILGDLVLTNKLVVYDLEHQTIGWTDYNCSSSIKVKDGTSGSTYTVGAHKISSASTLLFGRILTFLLLLIVMPNGLMDVMGIRA